MRPEADDPIVDLGLVEATTARGDIEQQTSEEAEAVHRIALERMRRAALPGEHPTA